jgi:hypothetical protein
LWVSYTFEFRKPKNFTGRGFAISQDYFVQNTGLTSAAWFGTPSSLLSGITNSIGCQLCSAVDVKNNPASPLGTTSNTLVIVFPQSVAGYFEVVLSIEGFQTTASVGSWATFTILNNCNIAKVNDLYSSDSATTDTPDGLMLSTTPAASNMRCIALYHIKLSPATNGVNNAFEIAVSIFNNPNAPQATLLIREYNALGSYKNQNQGSSDAPMLVNSSGVITPV